MASKDRAPATLPEHAQIRCVIEDARGRLVIDGPLELLREFLSLVARDGPPSGANPPSKGGTDGTAP